MTTMRIGGLASGMDIDSLVEKLMMTERAPLDKLEQKKQTYEWQRDAYREVNTKLKTFDTFLADNYFIRSMSVKTATTSNSNFVTAEATSAASGTLTIEGVSQLATAARGISSQINATGTTTMGQLLGGNLPASDKQYIEIRAIQKDGSLATKPTKIEYTSSMNISDFVSKLNSSNAGVTAIFENGRLSITSTNTGDVKNSEEVVIGNGSEVFQAFGFDPNNIFTKKGTNAVFQVNGIATERSTNTFTISGYNVTLKDTFNSQATINATLKDAFNDYKFTKENYDSKSSIYDTKSEAFQSAQSDYTKAYNDNFLTKYVPTDIQTIWTKLGRPDLLAKLDHDTISTVLANIDSTSQESIIAGLETISDEIIPKELKDELKTLTPEAFKTLQELNVDNYNSLRPIAILETKYINLNKTFLKDLSPDEITVLADLDLSGDAPLDNLPEDHILNNPENKALKDNLGKLAVEELNILDTLSEDQLLSFKNIATAEVTLNTAENEMNLASVNKAVAENQKNSSFQIFKDLYIQNGLVPDGKTKEELDAMTDEQLEELFNSFTEVPRITVTEMKENTVTLASSTNVDEMIDKIKEFVQTYNGLITDLNNLTNETKYRDYKPLTTLQRKEMEDKEIELWEEKAKSGLLRGDSTIREGISSMRNLIYQSNPAIANIKFNTLFSVGITTSKDYLSGGTLEIDDQKLRDALNEDPDSVLKLFTFDGEKEAGITVNGETKTADTRGFLRKLRGEIDVIESKIVERAGRASMNETQFTLGSYLRDVNKRIDTWQDKLVEIEDRYWRQFGAMEQMINKANQQSTMLMGSFYQ
ncbi:flagellar filament capping protein FliD [Ureibacillus acetophenoni]|uniref:Flagellar hook-associated protein 2 n=1 Tax=Ureibacillus acetophenoni TaxID=614649 RepID=A0A285TZ62_9BACL|nr:flagellar filament capping protein FliD [Ureibacillus acetophenoni]SOC34974.1 flagellar hook-associated protein 2 [Ureibacillus acetophenoni]